jgi:predicted 2-oxoglutarate/Fe(II)-dependent dioxygenase YbiX
MIEHLQISNFLDPSDCAALRAELRQTEGGAAALLADHGPGPVLPRVRKVTQVAAAPAAR